MWVAKQGPHVDCNLQHPAASSFFCGKLAEKVANCNYVTVGHCNRWKCGLVANHPDHNHVITEVLSDCCTSGMEKHFVLHCSLLTHKHFGEAGKKINLSLFFLLSFYFYKPTDQW